MTLSRLHRWNAYGLFVFLAAHFANHLVGFAGIDAHLEAQRLLRTVYRVQVVDIGLFILFGTQIILGALLATKRWCPSSYWGWLQILSGGYIGLFLLQHLGAIAFARLVPPGLDTNSYFAAAVLSQSPFVWYFAPYYVLGITSVFVHIAAAAHFSVFREKSSRWLHVIPMLGLVLGLGTVIGLMELPEGVDLPTEYQAYLEKLLPGDR